MLRTDKSRSLYSMARVTGISFCTGFEFSSPLNIHWFMKSGLENLKQKRVNQGKVPKHNSFFLKINTFYITLRTFVYMSAYKVLSIKLTMSYLLKIFIYQRASTGLLSSGLGGSMGENIQADSDLGLDLRTYEIRMTEPPRCPKLSLFIFVVVKSRHISGFLGEKL